MPRTVKWVKCVKCVKCDHPAMITLHYYPGNASLAPHVVLHELGVPFELSLVDRTVNAHKSPEYLKLNPNGLIPVLVDGDLVLVTARTTLHDLAEVAKHLELHEQLAPLASSKQHSLLGDLLSN